MMSKGFKNTVYVQRFTALLLCSCVLSACAPEMDMQGHDPREYYEQHPIKNQVETRGVSQQLHFDSGATRLDNGEVMRLKSALHGISPMAADGVQVQMATSDYRNSTRRKHMIGVLRSMGYAKDKISFEPSSALMRNDVQVDVQYAAVIPPENCPDWRRSPVTTYSNTTQGNFRCATETNLGAMVADPHDLVQGPSNITPDTQRSTRIVEQYRGGQAFGQAVNVTNTGDSGGSGGSDGGSGDSGPPPAE